MRTKEITHNKLVRDKIPAEIEARGAFCVFRKMRRWEFIHELGRKLIEEATEVAAHCGGPPEDEFQEASWDFDAMRQGAEEELADLLTVAYELQCALGISSLRMSEVINEKMRRKGRFSERILLEQSWEEA